MDGTPNDRLNRGALVLRLKLNLKSKEGAGQWTGSVDLRLRRFDSQN